MSQRKRSNISNFKEYLDEKHVSYKVLVSNYGTRLRNDQFLIMGAILGIFCTTVFFISLMNIVSGQISFSYFVLVIAGASGLSVSRKMIKIGFPTDD